MNNETPFFLRKRKLSDIISDDMWKKKSEFLFRPLIDSNAGFYCRRLVYYFFRVSFLRAHGFCVQNRWTQRLELIFSCFSKQLVLEFEQKVPLYTLYVCILDKYLIPIFQLQTKNVVNKHQLFQCAPHFSKSSSNQRPNHQSDLQPITWFWWFVIGRLEYCKWIFASAIATNLCPNQ